MAKTDEIPDELIEKAAEVLADARGGDGWWAELGGMNSNGRRLYRKQARAVAPLLFQAGRSAAASDAEAAMRAESDRLAALETPRAVEQGIGVASSMNAVLRAVRGDTNEEGRQRVQAALKKTKSASTEEGP